MQRDTLSIAIVGLGPRGINVLERMTAHASYGPHASRPGRRLGVVHGLRGPQVLHLLVPRLHVDATALVDAGRTVGELFAKIQSAPIPEQRHIANIAV